MTPRNTVERIHPRYFTTKEKYLLYLRHVFAYEEARRRIGTSAGVLEIGCGDGYGTAILAEQAARVTAVDVEAETVAHAAAQYPDAGIDFRTYDGERLPFDAGSFDAVVAFQVIEHVEDDAGFVAEAHRVLRPGGVLLVTTPNRAHRVPPGEPLWNPFHVREYLPDELETVLRTVFTQVEVAGIRGEAEVQRIEHARVRRGPSLRKMIPEPVRAWFDGDVAARYSTACFFVTRDAADGLDLLGMCLKAG